MTQVGVKHNFFPVGQGLFVAGSIEFWPPPPKRRRRIEIDGYEKPPAQPPYRWVYDCGSSTAKRLVTNAIADLKNDCSDSRIDLLTISHFHNDHISGVVDLLKAIGAKTVMLPWAPLWHRLLIGFDQGLRADDPEILFFVDPVQYLIQEFTTTTLPSDWALLNRFLSKFRFFGGFGRILHVYDSGGHTFIDILPLVCLFFERPTTQSLC